MSSQKSKRVQRTLQAIGFSLTATFLLSACGKKEATPFDPFAIDLKQAVANLQSGDVVARLEKAQSKETPFVTPDASEQALTWASGYTSGDASGECRIPEPDSDSRGSRDSDDANADRIRSLGVCLRQAISPALIAVQAMSYWKAYVLPEGAQALPALSDLSDDDLQLYLLTHYKKLETIIGNSPEIESLLKLQRKHFTDADLDELMALVKRRDRALMWAEKKISSWFKSAKLSKTVKQAVKSWDRYRAMELLVSEIDRTGVTAYQSLVPLLLANSEISLQLKSAGYLTASGSMHDQAQASLPLFNMHPYALLALIPRAGEENTHLRGTGQNPLFVIKDFQGELGDFSGKITEKNATIDGTLQNYKKYRGHDLKQVLSLENQKPFAADAVKIAFIDTGMDYLQYPELAPFLSKGSQDYADLDDSPFLPAVGLLDHGTATAASLLTVLSQKAPEILKNRGIELAMWKLSSLRSLLSGVLENDLWRWNPRHTVSFFDLLLDQGKKLSTSAFLPKIVSLSATFPSRNFILRSGQQELLKKTPWLWVMAAGNEGVNIDASKTACFQDIPEDYRGQEKILCVGALVKRQGKPKIAQYSNYGDAVTVYAYESYQHLCPSGTSCATPAISAAATLIASKFPALTASEIKRVILEASEVKTLEVELDSRAIAVLVKSGQPIPSHEVKVFDPLTHMDEALKIAAEMSKAAQSKNFFK